MTQTTAADYPHLGFDPTPGDHAAINHIAGQVGSAVDALAEISSVLNGAADGEWRGQAAIAFRDLLDDDLRPRIDEAYQSFGYASRVIGNWTAYVDSSQIQTRRLEERAAEAAARLSAAEGGLAALPAAPTSATPPPENDRERRRREEEEQEREQAQQAVTEAQGELEGIRGEARRLGEEYKAEGERAAELLKTAMEQAPNEPGFWSGLADAFGEALSDLGDVLSDLGDIILEQLEKIAPLLKIIGDVAGLLSAICGLLAFIPGLQFLAVPALILGGVALMAHYLEAAGKTGSFVEALKDPDVIMDAVGLVLGIGALKVGGQLVRAAQASGNTRMVPQLIGPAQEVPLGMFSMARSASYTMEQSEFAWRVASLKLTQGGLFHTGAGASGNFGTAGDIATWNWGPTTQEPSVR